MPMARSISARELKERRAKLGLTQAQLAQQMGVTWNTVARWETDQRRIPPMAAILLAYIERSTRPRTGKKGAKLNGPIQAL